MYNVFDNFLTVETWPTCGPADEERFFEALGQVVRHPNFDPAVMGEYLRKRAVSRPDGQAVGAAIEHYVSGARTIRDYLFHIAAMHP